MSFGPLFQSQPCFTDLGCQHYKPNRFFQAIQKKLDWWQERMQRVNVTCHMWQHSKISWNLFIKFSLVGGPGKTTKRSDRHSFISRCRAALAAKKKNESETTMLANVSRARSLGKEEKNNGQQPVPALVQLFCPPTSGVAILWTLLTQV